MNNLESVLKETAGKQTLFMSHCIAGFPTTAQSKQVALALTQSGADIIELQIPFSDPMADGPTIAAACQEALSCGITVHDVLLLAGEIVSKSKKPLVIMSYLNPVFRYGIAKFVRDAARAGVSGFIIPDAPFDSPEGRELLRACAEHNVVLIPVVSPGVPEERLRVIAKDARGFVYCTSRQGITGANSNFAKELARYLTSMKDIFGLPVGLGFGIRTRADVEMSAKSADIIIAGSVFVEAIRQKGNTTAAQRVARVATVLTDGRR
jgi:tryptophan synthase alpha subunit